MLPMVPKPAITRRQKSAALAIAGAADLLQVFLLPALLPGFIADEFSDFVVAFLLIAICGFKWQFVLAFFLELVPGLGLLPTWTAVVATLPVRTEATPGFANTNDKPSEHPPIHVSAVVVPPKQDAEHQSARR